jgi:hypothetical protein
VGAAEPLTACIPQKKNAGSETLPAFVRSGEFCKSRRRLAEKPEEFEKDLTKFCENLFTFRGLWVIINRMMP